jgi:UDP-N-acetylglucosamine acyltransferase
LNIVGLRRRGFSAELVENIRNAYKLIYSSNLTVNEAVARIKEEIPMSKEIEYIIDFVSNSERGIIR